MDSFLQMNIFFFVTTVAVVILAILGAFALYFVVRILRNVDRLSEAAVEESTLIRGDISELRANVKKEGAKLKHFAEFGRKFAGRFGQKAKKESKGDRKSESTE